MSQNPFDQIRILVTGGTIDKTYSPVEGVLGFSRTHVLAMLRQGGVEVPESQIETVLLKDSLEMTDADRDTVLRACASAEEPRLLITHGTDTMILTAARLAHANLGKAVVLVGAMVPYTFSNSDGLFNLGCAFAALQLVVPGVYICMNGRVFPWDKVRKNRQAGRFEDLRPSQP
jgi:L-asparaginase